MSLTGDLGLPCQELRMHSCRERKRSKNTGNHVSRCSEASDMSCTSILSNHLKNNLLYVDSIEYVYPPL